MSIFAYFPALLLKRRRLIRSVCGVVVVALAVMPVLDSQSQVTVPDYKNPRLPVDQRVNDLVSRMTLEEKVAQLIGIWQARPQAKPQTDFSSSRGEFSPEKARGVLANGIGQIARQRERMGPERSDLRKRRQKCLIEIQGGHTCNLHDEILHATWPGKYHFLSDSAGEHLGS